MHANAAGETKVKDVVSRPRFGYLEGPTGAYWGLLGPTVISVSIWLPVSSVLSACYCLEEPKVA